MDGSVSWKVPAEPLPARRTETPADREKLEAEIERLAADGYSCDEVGRRLGVPAARVMRIAARKKITMAGRGGRRHLTVGISGQDLSLVNMLAREAGISRADMIVRLALLSLKDGVGEARARLGPQGRPKRKYTLKKPRGPRSSYQRS